MRSTNVPIDAPPTPTSAQVVPISTGVAMITEDRMEKGERLSAGATTRAPATTTKNRRLFFLGSLLVMAALIGVLAGVLSAHKNGRSLTPDESKSESESSPTVQSSSEVPVDTATEEDPTFCCGDHIDKNIPHYCKYPIGDCGATPEDAVCEIIPFICTMQYDPVCGCDGETYGNACGAAGRGVSVRSLGECPANDSKICDCGGDDCILVFPTGDCGVSDEGECQERPTFCGRIDAPVCGCDGIIYLNECEARKEGGTSVSSVGECP